MLRKFEEKYVAKEGAYKINAEEILIILKWPG